MKEFASDEKSPKLYMVTHTNIDSFCIFMLCCGQNLIFKEISFISLVHLIKIVN